MGNEYKRGREQSKILVPGYTLQRTYIDLIRRGSKTIEGRINSGGFSRLEEGSQIKFFDRREPTYDVLCNILGIGRYKTFIEMLEAEGFLNMIPDASSLDEAVRIYNGIPSYPERARRYGVLALRLQVVTPEK